MYDWRKFFTLCTLFHLELAISAFRNTSKYTLLYRRRAFKCNRSLNFCRLFLIPSKMPADQIQYSEKYSDDRYDYRHVILPADIARHVPKTHLMTETEWRNLGVQQSPGWVHYMMHGPEPHVLLFRRMRTDLPVPKCTVSQGEPITC